MLTHKQIDEAIDKLVDTKYMHQVAEVLDTLDTLNKSELTSVIAAALARSVVKGYSQGVQKERNRLKVLLGLQ